MTVDEIQSIENELPESLSFGDTLGKVIKETIGSVSTENILINVKWIAFGKL